MAVVVGVDIGGSGVRAAAVSSAGELGEIRRVALIHRGVDAVIDAVRAVSLDLGATAVGVGVPGFVRDGRVVASPNFPEWSDIPLAKRLSAALGCPVHVENDANAAAFGVYVARGRRRDVLVLTLGTGVGGGIVTGGRLFRGSGGTGAELGHVRVGGNRACGCGGRGCLEMWVGTVGLVAAAAERGFAVRDGAAVVAAADAGENWALSVMSDAAEALGLGLASLTNLFNPEEIVLCGGLSGAQRHLAQAEVVWRAEGIRANTEDVSIVWEGRADAFAIAGAAWSSS